MGAIVLAVALVLGHGAGSAAAQGLTLAEAIGRALERSPLLAAASHERARAAAGVDRARAAFFPRLDTGYGYTRSDQPVYAFGSKLNQGRFTETDFDVDRLNSPGAIDNFRGAVTLRQPLYTGGKTTLGLEQAETARRIAALESERATQEIIFQVVRAYLALRLAQERLAAADASVKAGESNQALAQSRVRAGQAVESDLLAAEVRLARLREDALAARSRVGVAQTALNDAMGTPLDVPLEATDPLTLRPAGGEPPPARDVLAQRPDYHALELTEEARGREVRLARAEFLPTVSAEASYEVNQARAFGDGQGSWSVMALLQWNLFQGGADRARIREAEAVRDRARALRERAASQIGLEVREARARLDTARERAAVAERAIAQAEEALRIVGSRYRGGLATVVDLLGAEAALTDARLRLSEALFDQNLGLAAWELALGRLRRDTLR